MAAEPNGAGGQIGGTHYSRWHHQPVTVAHEWGLSGPLYSAIKYIARHKLKGAPVKNLKKACHFVALELEHAHGIPGIAERVADALEKGAENEHG